MRPAHVAVGATGPSNWIILDHLESGFGVGYQVDVQKGTTVTYTVQYGFYMGEPISLANLTRSTTTATATWRVGTDDYSASNGMQDGDCVFMGGYGAPFDGVFTVTVSSATVFTFPVANSGPTASTTGLCQRVSVGDAAVAGATGSTSGNFIVPPNMVRLNLTAFTAGGRVTLMVNQGIST